MAPTPQSRSQELINVKLLLIGNSSVGKTSLFLRFSDEHWSPEDEASATIGVDFRVRSHTSSHTSFFSLHYLLTFGTGCALLLRLCVVGILYQVHKLEVQGRKVKMSVWVRNCAAFLSSKR
jgi:GTPase SAR1 family protein